MSTCHIYAGVALIKTKKFTKAGCSEGMVRGAGDGLGVMD